MRFLWQFVWWRYLLLQLMRCAPSSFSDWLAYRSGLVDGLESHFRRVGNLDAVRRVRAMRSRMRQVYGP